MKTLLLFILCFPLAGLAQRFTLRHISYGLGSNHDRTYDRLSIDDSLLVLSYTVYTGEVAKDEDGFSYDVTKDSTFTAVFRQASIDSIRALLTELAHTQITGSNPCVKSGSIVTLDICCDGKPTAFWLANTYDSTALGIVTIVNTYLPAGLKLHIPYGTWEAARNCGYARNANRRRPIGEAHFPK